MLTVHFNAQNVIAKHEKLSYGVCERVGTYKAHVMHIVANTCRLAP